MFARARTCIVFFALMLFAAPLIVSANSIDSFDVVIRVQSDGSAEVTEEIHYDFGPSEHHGIYRDIPAAYIDAQGHKQMVKIDGIKVLDGKLSPVMFESFKNGDYMRVKIGDPDVLVTGKKTYDISYVAHGVVAFYDEYDELYWNVTGNEWLFPIHHALSLIHI